MQEMMPAQFGRIKFGDISWEEFSGSFIDMQGVMSQVSIQITGTTIGLQLQSKAIIEDTANRILKAVGIAGTTLRDPFTSITTDMSTSKISDQFHASFSSFIQGMKGEVMSMLGDIDNNEIQDFGSGELANVITNNIEQLTNSGLDSAGKTALDTAVDTGLSLIGNKLSLPGGLGSILDFSMVDKYAQIGKGVVKNTAGNSSQDTRTKRGSGRVERYFEICMGEKGGKENVTGAPAGTGTTMDPVNQKAKDTADRELLKLDGEKKKEKEDRENRGKENNKIVALEPDMTDPRNVPPIGAAAFATQEEYVPVDVMQFFAENHTWDPVNERSTLLNPLESAQITDLTGSDSTGKGSDFITDDLIIDLFANMGFGGKMKSISGEFTTDAPEDALIYKLRDGDPVPKGVEKYKRIPSGYNAEAFATRLRQEDAQANDNFDLGDPNVVVVKNPGHKYFFYNEEKPEYCFPSIKIKGYEGIPVPVVDPNSGELVGILVEMLAFDTNEAFPPVGIIPDSSPVGILTNDPDYDFEVGGFLIANTGFNYKKARIEMIDKDTGEVAGEAKAVVRFNGRIVGYEILNSGKGFKRLPEVRVVDSGKEGFGAQLLPIISVISKDQAKPIPLPVQMIFCPAKTI